MENSWTIASKYSNIIEECIYFEDLITFAEKFIDSIIQEAEGIS